MNYEQKYKEALRVMESLYNVVKYQSSSDALLTVQTIEKSFPELCESEDEKIRKELIRYVKEWQTGYCMWNSDEDFCNDAIAWLEKQGEQKPEENKGNLGKISSNWSEEDEKLYNSALWHIKNSCGNGGKDSGEYEVYNWLKSIKDRVQQPKQEWSEYDEIQLSEAIQMIEANGTWIRSEDAVKKVSNWLKSLKSLKPNHWKPSEEQMEALKKECIAHSNYQLCRLLEELEKL